MTYLRVDSDITTKEMVRTISCLSNNKALRLNRIPNKALKICRSLIALWLIDVTKVYFAIDYYLRLKRAITIIILCKEDKVDYLLLKNYHFIVLKNTLSKILKRVIAECIADTAKEYALLL